jgi:F5/8 type C domain
VPPAAHLNIVRIISRFLFPFVLLGFFCALDANAQTVTVDTNPARARSFDPDQALGTSIDILPANLTDTVYSEPVLKESLSAGWGPITYRQNTELTIAAWHWNPNGTWSNAAEQSGYFTGSAEPKEFIRHSFGYALTHRGTTRSDASERKYSRLTDGDESTYWKSNPYLSSKFTGEADALHPQWIVVDLDSPRDVDALRIVWANPFARKYSVQYWTGEDAMNKPAAGNWTDFPKGNVEDGSGNVVTIRLADAPVKTRFVRILLAASSNTCDTHGNSDPRNCVGYAVNEIYLGNFTASGEFVDLITHTSGQNQTATYASSSDPWHTAKEIESTRDQSGFDLFFSSGIANKLPAMIPVSMLYGTPEDSAAEIAYIEKRGYPISYVEMGEEPDGQWMLPEDYAALYLQWADALHRVDPKLKLGGPVFAGTDDDVKAWPDSSGRTSWLGRFIDYLKTRGRLNDFTFMSFEHYPFPPCDIGWSDLYREPELVKHILQIWRDDGVPANVPLMITESNLSWELTAPMADVLSALWLADNAGSFLANGGGAFYHSPIQPEPLRPGCHGWSTYGNFVADEKLVVRQHTAQYFASQMINLEWAKHGSGRYELFPADSDVKDDAGHTLVTAYAAKAADGEWSLMLINKDQSNAHDVFLKFSSGDNGGAAATLAGKARIATFGAEQYVWHPDGAKSYAEPDGPLHHAEVEAKSGAAFTLPKASVTVIRGRLAELSKGEK